MSCSDYGMKKWPARLAAPVYALDNTVAAFWQSRCGMKRPPQLVDLHELARKLRR